MTSNQRALILDHVVIVRNPTVDGTPYQRAIRVVSAEVEGSNPLAFWLEGDGEKIRDTTAELLSQSFKLAMVEATSGNFPELGGFRTFRYLEGNQEKIDRVQFVQSTCERTLLRTLRGTLLSIPRQQNENPEAGALVCSKAKSGAKRIDARS